MNENRAINNARVEFWWADCLEGLCLAPGIRVIQACGERAARSQAAEVCL